MKSARPLYDIAQALQSADAPEARVSRVLDLLREIVPYDRCALLEAQPAQGRRLVLAPPDAAGEDADLARALDEMLGLLLEHQRPLVAGASPATRRPRSPWPQHLAVPLIGLDQVIGLLFVGRAAPCFQAAELRLLSVVAAQIATYLTTLRLYREKDEFLAMLSHELRTPLTAVLGWARLLRSGSVPVERRDRALDAIARGAGALGRQIEDLVDLSRIRTGKLRLDLVSVTPERLVEAAVEAARPEAEARSLRLDFTSDGGAGQALADPERLQQIVGNLLTNAVKFTPSGGRIEVRVEHEPGGVRIRVRDTGIGIPPELLPRIFDRYCQAAPASRRGQDGLGLGLAIVRHLVELHGGQIRAESAGEACGTTFVVDLPLAGPAPPEARPPAPRPATDADDLLGGVRVLVIDDDAEVREIVATILEVHGAAVTTATSAAEATEVLERSSPHVLVCDISMPEMDGYAFVRHVIAREAQGGRRVPAAALTAHAGSMVQDRALAAGFQACLTKPVEPSQLVTTVARLARGW